MEPWPTPSDSPLGVRPGQREEPVSRLPIPSRLFSLLKPKKACVCGLCPHKVGNVVTYSLSRMSRLVWWTLLLLFEVFR